MAKPFRTVSALNLSHYILSFVHASQFKIQKLVYYSESRHLAYFEIPLIDEDFEAWVHGPAVRSLWDHYKGRGSYTTEFYLPPESGGFYHSWQNCGIAAVCPRPGK